MILAEKRKTVGLTQSQCADMVGVTRVTWTRWETGVSSMPIATLRLWLHLAGIELLPTTAPVTAGTAPVIAPVTAPA